jgi:hypothetical protein
MAIARAPKMMDSQPMSLILLLTFCKMGVSAFIVLTFY